MNDARLRAAEDAGLPPVIADRLRGDSPEALAADAFTFARTLGLTPPVMPPARDPNPYDQGAGPGPGPDDMTPHQRIVAGYDNRKENR